MNTFTPVEPNDPAGDCLLKATLLGRYYPAQADDILTDDELLDLFRIIKQILKKAPDTDRIAKLLFCITYALGDNVKFAKPVHEDRILFRDYMNHTAGPGMGVIQLTPNSSCCHFVNGFHDDPTQAPPPPQPHTDARWLDASTAAAAAAADSPFTRLLSSVNCLDSNPHPIPPPPPSSSSTTTTTDIHPPPPPPPQSHHMASSSSSSSSSFPPSSTCTSDDAMADSFAVRSYTNFQSLLQQHHPPPPPSQQQQQPGLTPPPQQQPEFAAARYPHLQTLLGAANASGISKTPDEVLMEPKQRGFYYQDGRISREPALLQRYAEQGVLTQASLMRKRKRQLPDNMNYPYELATLPASVKKPKIPHRHGEFEQRRDEIISRMRSITLSDLEQKVARLPDDFTLAIEQAPVNFEVDPSRKPEQAADLLEPALRILTTHSNMKPHLDNGMNQNGIYYNSDYFRLYLAFVQFQKCFAALFPSEVVPIPDDTSSAEINTGERDRDRERNTNMKAYRGWLEPLLTETNWAAFRRNIVVGERMMQLTKVVGQGVLLMTKELSGSKLHLTFTNNEWDEFINGLNAGKWDYTIKWESEPPLERTSENENQSKLVIELQRKFATRHWFRSDGMLVPPEERRISLRSSIASSYPSSSTTTTTVTPSSSTTTPSTAATDTDTTANTSSAGNDDKPTSNSSQNTDT
ncbi:hypothetical protein RO3G_05184 [Lichtheimia corymbifera JMRC:FSU:9682]|uniref:Uncharacterized protein n=1 Tax=Lichtheimia corymbifera JMRC:FSU:9682 TaxID=1263082 RepID=A0A068SC83_9FUNG|nr:hypothetical protein RO3G_05184 [Lichtheimia corymbifera JMRC:FSU:9682]